MPVSSLLVSDSRQRLALLSALFVLLTGVYLLTFSGRVESGDTLALFDAAASFTRHGDTLFGLSAGVNPPRPALNTALYPLETASVEPLPVLAAAPLLWLAERLPGVGLVHAVWLLNVLVSAAAAVVLFLYARSLRYADQTAAAAALAFGLATIIWPYSKTMFREPLLLLLLLLTALLLERWRAGGFRSPLLLIGAVLALAGAFLTKEAVVFALPALLVIALPAPRLTPRLRQVAAAALAALLAGAGGVALLAYAGLLDYEAIYRLIGGLMRRPAVELAAAHTALHTYLLSIGGSVWATSPVLLLALPGGWLLFRQGRYRYLFAALLLLAGFAGGYALLRGVHWFGGLSWPPRFLVPVVPLLLLVGLPAFDRALARPRSGWGLAAAALFLYGVWVQLSGTTLEWGAYNAALPPEAGRLSEWGGGLNVVQYLRWVLIPSQWGRWPLDAVWSRAGSMGWPLMFAALTLAAALWLGALLQGRRSAQRAWLLGVAPVVLALALWLGLRSIYDDPLYQPPQHEALAAALADAQARAQADDVLLFNSDSYQPYLLNHARLSQPRLIVLADQPGEQPSPEQPPLVQSVNPDALLTPATISLLHNLAARRDRLWLLADSSQWLSWSVRPVERFMAAHYYVIGEREFDPTVRLIEYSTVSAPDPYAFRAPEYSADLDYGRAIRLIGYDLPLGTVYQPGGVLPVSLYWAALQPLQHDYVVALFLGQGDIPVVQGADSKPGGGFEHTSAWVPDMPVWDNRALHLPSDLPSGEYHLWVVLYHWEADGSTVRLNLTDPRLPDAAFGLLPERITIGG